MGFTLLHTLVWLITHILFTTQELVKLRVSPDITAECGQQVTLNCDVSSSLEGLAVKHMRWSQDNTSLCSVDAEGKITHHTPTLSDFHCEYKHGGLTLTLKQVGPLDSGAAKRYMCKLQSNKGASHDYVRVELQDCCGIVEGDATSKGPICTFRNVYPDGDVHWFQGSHNLSDGTVRHHTTKHVDKAGWLTIRSHLEWKSSHGPYNCSLWSATSGAYIASTLVQNSESLQAIRVGASETTDKNGVGSQGPVWTCFCISIVLAVTLK